MAKNIVLLADGTGNSAAKAFKTNVWRLYQALDLGGIDQIAVFTDGVGTAGFKPFEIVGLALGFGVKRRVLALYKFLCLNYEEGDEIYAFGFSRGAFIVRVLVGLITREGLLPPMKAEDLNRNAVAAYRAYRAAVFKPKHSWQFWVGLSRSVRRDVVKLWNQATGNASYEHVKEKRKKHLDPENIEIEFLGVWDTVAAYGLPVDELTRAVNDWVWPLTFEKRELRPQVKCGRQAFSIDDERRTFFPIPWNEWRCDGKPQPDLQQVWFAGCHANVGGGYPDDRLSYIPLCWMIGEAAEKGLRFEQEVVADYWETASESGRIYDSRSRFGVFYRYHPRSARHLLNDPSYSECLPPKPRIKPLVDSSVIIRLAKGGDGYAPVSLPPDIDILTPLGEKVPFPQEQPSGQIPAAAPVSDKLPLPSGRKRDLQVMERNFRVALTKLQRATVASNRAELVKLTDDVIWWRRGLYYVLLSLAIVLLLFPVLGGYLARANLGNINTVSNAYFRPILSFFEGLLPGFLAPWLKAMAQYSVPAVAIGALLTICLWLNSVLRVRINDRSRIAWGLLGREKTRKDNRVGNDELQRFVLLLGICSLAAAAAFSPNWKPSGTGSIWEAYDIGLMFVVCSAVFFACIGWFFVLRRRNEKPLPKVPRSLRFARAVRTSQWGQRLYHWLREYVLPATFLVASIAAIIILVNKFAFEILNSGGQFCERVVGEEPDGKSIEQLAKFDHKTMDFCQGSGIRLQEGVAYKVTLKTTSPWKDVGPWDSYDADLAGLSNPQGFVHYIASPIKRWWGVPWFKPIARIGRFGNEEYVLNPIQPPGENMPTEQQAEDKSARRVTQDELVAELRPTTSGELYLYVNDAVVALPYIYDGFYGKNEGTATVTVERMPVPGEGGMAKDVTPKGTASAK